MATAALVAGALGEAGVAFQAPPGWRRGAARPTRTGRAGSRRSRAGRTRGSARGWPTARSSTRGRRRTAAPSAPNAGVRRDRRPSPRRRRGSRSTATRTCDRAGSGPARAPACGSGPGSSRGRPGCATPGPTVRRPNVRSVTERRARRPSLLDGGHDLSDRSMSTVLLIWLTASGVGERRSVTAFREGRCPASDHRGPPWAQPVAAMSARRPSTHAVAFSAAAFASWRTAAPCAPAAG